MATPPRTADEDQEHRQREGYNLPGELTETVINSLRWTISSRLIRDGTRLALGVLLARLLTPAEWGIAGMALVVVWFVAMFTDVGLAAALIQRPHIDEKDRSTLFWGALIIGCAASVASIAISGLVADFFGEPDVQTLFAVASVTFAISSLEKVPGTLLAREMAFRALEVRQISATLAGAAVSLVLALAGAGAWAIIGNAVATAIVSCALLWIFVSWRPKLMFSWDSFRRMTHFGGTLLASQIATYFQVNGDKILIGRHLSAAALGSYQFAYQLMFMPIGSISYPLQAVLFPALSSIQEDRERATRAWLRGKRLSVAAMTPLFLTLLVTSADLVPNLFGEQWSGAVPVVQLLSIGGVAYSLSTLNTSILLAYGKVGTLFRLACLTASVVVAFAAIGLHWGVKGVAAMVAIALWGLVVPDMWFTTRGAQIDFAPALGAALSPLPAAAVATATAAGVRLALVDFGAGPVVRILGTGLVLLAVYPVLLYATSRPIRPEFRGALARLRRRLERTN